MYMCVCGCVRVVVCVCGCVVECGCNSITLSAPMPKSCGSLKDESI